MKKITIIFMSVLMIFASCSMDTSYNDIIENAETVEKSKEDDTKNNTEEPSNEEPKKKIILKTIMMKKEILKIPKL